MSLLTICLTDVRTKFCNFAPERFRIFQNEVTIYPFVSVVVTSVYNVAGGRRRISTSDSFSCFGSGCLPQSLPRHGTGRRSQLESLPTSRNRDVLTLIDFSLPSTVERFFVFDMARRRLLFSSVVAHGKNSGENYATSFSNEYGSYKSSLGFYLTGSTYQGSNGYSLLLDGLEKGINDRARERAIVVHGAAYADPSVASRGGRLGRSFGCPALPQKLSRPIIDAIKDGSVMYIYAPTPEYLAQSTVLNASDLPDAI